MSNWICQYCGKDTTNVDIDYMVGFDHLSCVLESGNKKPKVMKIKGWEKINGYTYKGYSIVNPIHNAQETKYEATILNLNLPQTPKWDLSVLTPQHKFIVGENTADGIFFISMWDDNRFSTTRQISKEKMKSISIFRNIFEEMVDEILGVRLISAGVNASSHSLNINVNGAQRMHINTNGHATIGNNISGGIISKVNNSGAIMVYDAVTGTSIDLVNTIKELQKQIDELKQTNDADN